MFLIRTPSRQLSLFMTSLAIALGLMANTAAAQVEVLDEETDGHCAAVTVTDHQVEGGCHVEYTSEGHFSVVAYSSGGGVVGIICDLTFEARIGEDGSGYATNIQVSTEAEGTVPPCERAPCDEPTHEVIPWPIQITRNAGVQLAELELCLRPAAYEEGGAHLRCQLHLPLTHFAGHDHEIGDHGEHFCENISIVAVRDLHLVGETPSGEGTEDIYLAPASGQVEVLDEDGDHQHCPPIALDGQTISGGCHVEYESEEHVAVVVQTASGPMTLFVCNWDLEARVDEGGAGYVTSATFSNETPPSVPGCTLSPCRESGAMIPWPLEIRETAASETIEIEACLGGQRCELTMPLPALGGHNYEIGLHDQYFCEGASGSSQISLGNVHLVNATDPEQGTEDIEIIHL